MTNNNAFPVSSGDPVHAGSQPAEPLCQSCHTERRRARIPTYVPLLPSSRPDLNNLRHTWHPIAQSKKKRKKPAARKQNARITGQAYLIHIAVPRRRQRHLALIRIDRVRRTAHPHHRERDRRRRPGSQRDRDAGPDHRRLGAHTRDLGARRRRRHISGEKVRRRVQLAVEVIATAAVPAQAASADEQRRVRHEQGNGVLGPRRRAGGDPAPALRPRRPDLGDQGGVLVVEGTAPGLAADNEDIAVGEDDAVGEDAGEAHRGDLLDLHGRVDGASGEDVGEGISRTGSLVLRRVND